MRRAVVVTLSLLALLWACGGDDEPGSSPSSSSTSSSGSSSGATTNGADGSVDGSSGDASPDVDSGPPPILDPNFVYADLNQILLTGQSNAVSNSADPITTTQPYVNLMFDVGVMTCADCNGEGCETYETPTSFVAP